MQLTKGQRIMRDDYSSQGLLDLIKELGDTSNMRMVEIGSFIGESTIIFAQHFKEVIAIDPFLSGYHEEDPTSRFDFNDVYQEYLDRTKPYKNIKTITLTSDDAFYILKDELFDFIYIDGLHTYEGVLTDIKNYQPLVKPGGYIGGHDLGPTWEGIEKAVKEVYGKPDKVFKDTSWIKKL